MTFLFTDIEGSTRLLQRLGSAYRRILERHRELLREAVAEAGGVEVDAEGDGLLFVFGGVASAVTASVAGQLALAAERWPDGVTLRVRMGLHTGEAFPDDSGYVALAVHQAARVASAAHGGQVLLSDVTVAAVAGGLPAGASVKELGLFRLKDFDIPARIYQLCHEGLVDEFPVPAARPAVVGNLPVALASFVGREDELGQVNKLLSSHRLVTLIGAGGAGKTRLALEAAAAHSNAAADGVWFVDLAPVADPQLVAAAVADVLGVHQQSGRSLADVLAEWVSDQNLLLVVDNCEHVIHAAAALVERVLTGGAKVRVLATSREALRIGGEAVWRVPPLSLPNSSADADIETIMYCDSVRLFIDRALAARPDLPLDHDDVRAVARIVVRLDGLPLAIELAAARVGVLSVQAIAARLDDRFRLLVGGSRTALPRQQTLLAAIEWSYQLLDESEQAVLRRLSVFAGGFSLEATEVVGAGGDVSGGDVAGMVLALTSKSLVVALPPGGTSRARPDPWLAAPRFRLLETIRQYAADRLEDTDRGQEAEQARTDHADYYLAVAQAAEPELYRERQGHCLAMLALEHDNLRLALSRLAAHAERAADMLRMVVALRRFWHTHNHQRECQEYLERALHTGGVDVPDLARAEALNLAAEVVRFSDGAMATRYGQDALVLARQLGNKVVAARCLAVGLALPAHFRGEQESALAFAQESVELANQTGDLVVIGECLQAYALVAEDDFALGKRLNEEAIVATRRSGDLCTAAWAYNNLGSMQLAVGDVDSARDQIEQAITRFAELGSEKALPQINLGWVYLQQGKPSKATATFATALRLARRGHLQTEIAYAVLGSALCATADSRWERAAALHAFADSELHATGQTWAEPERTYRERDLESLRRRIGEGFLRAYDAGAMMRRDRIMQLALAPATDNDLADPFDRNVDRVHGRPAERLGSEGDQI